MSLNPITIKPEDFMKYPNMIDMKMFYAWSMKRLDNHYIPDEFIQAFPKKFKLEIQQLIDIIKTQKIHPKSIDAILSNFNEYNFPSLMFCGIRIENLNGTKEEINTFIEKYHKYINWKVNSSQLDEEQKIMFKDIIDWNSLCYTKDLTKRILDDRSCKEYLDWKRIEECKTYTDVKGNVLLEI